MAEINISQKDLSDAESFLTEYMAEKVPSANFAVGSAVRDLAVKAFTYLYAYLRGEIDAVAARQSLLRIREELTDADDIAQAVDEILSNWFVTRQGGQEARLTARLHFTERRATSIALAAQFWRTTTVIFIIDSEVDPYVIPEDQLFPIYDTRGTLVDYVAEVALKAVKSGEGYNIDPGTFVRVQIPGGAPYLSYVEHLEKSSGGTSIESSDDLITRAETAITVRNCINNRSCDATLQENFPEIIDTLTVGMGEAEMTRDRRTEISPAIELHMGGHYDTYVDLRLTQMEENLTVGGYFARPDHVANIFRDPQLTIDIGTTFTFLGIQPGHVLYVQSGIVGVPRGFPIIAVSDHELEVSLACPFPEASDELTTNAVSYSVGWLSPGFDELILTRTAAVSAGSPDIPCGTSRHIQVPGRVVLDGSPVQNILNVEITDPDTGDVRIDPSTNTIIFRTRVNDTPTPAVDATSTEYQLIVTNPDYAQSEYAVNEINVLSSIANDGKNLRVVYQTLDGFYNIHAYVIDRDTRVSAANHLLRGRHPIWINFNVDYRLKPTAAGTLDTTAAAQALATYINEFDSNDDLDTSDISAFLRQNYAVIGAVYPLTITYTLSVPDGQQVEFSTTDIISIFMDNGVTLLNSADITPPQNLINRGITSIATSADLRDWFNYVGISDRTIRYRTTESLITFTLRT